MAINWFVYIWAMNNDHVLQSSLGYYINPLVNVLFGTLILKERLRPAQMLAVAIAAGGVLYLTIHSGEFPWIALTLAFSFGLYGLIRKMAAVGPLVGLAVETLLFSVPALIYLLWLGADGRGAFTMADLRIDLILMGTALVTGLPLLLFAVAAKRLNLSTVGFLQYIAPSGQFLLAVYAFHEPLSRARVWTFAIIWLALIIYSADSLIHFRRSSHHISAG